MPARKKVSTRQLELLLEFAESNQDIALGRFPAGPLANQATRREWESLSVQLNSIAEGTIKTPDQWRRYWIEYKAKTKTKAADCRRYASRTGGGPNRLVPLNAFEERVLALIGTVAVEGLPSVRVPINVPTETQVPETAHTEPGPSNPIASTSYSHPLQLQCSSETLASQGSIETIWLQVSDSQTPPSQSIIPPESSVQAVQEFEAQPEEPQQYIVPQPQPEESRPSLVSQPHAEEIQLEEPPPEPPRLPQPSRGTQRRRERRVRRNRLHEGVPRWAYDLETRRIAVEERQVEEMAGIRAVMEQTAARYLALTEETAARHLSVAEQIAADIRQIREKISDNNA